MKMQLLKMNLRSNALDVNSSGSTLTFEYDFEDWVSDGNGGNAFYAISSYIIVKSNSEISPAIIN